jgi:hypothetical protein
MGAGLLALLALFLPQGEVAAQTTTPNGDWELHELGPWNLVGDNGNQLVTLYDVNGDGKLSWCWRRKPGLDAGQPFSNGGCAQDVYLVAGEVYEFSADLAYAANC